MVDECKVVNVTQDVQTSTLVFKNPRSRTVNLTFDGGVRDLSAQESFAFDVPANTLHTWSAVLGAGYNTPGGVCASPNVGEAKTVVLPVVGLTNTIGCADMADINVPVASGGGGMDNLVLASMYVDANNAGESLSGLTANQLWAMDVNGDGVADTADVQDMVVCYISPASTDCNFQCGGVDRPSPCFGIGDPDMDGFVTSSDVDIIGSMIGETWDTTSDLEQFRRADTDGTGKITMSDLVQVGNYISGGIDTFPACLLAPMLVTEFTVACPASGDCTDCKAPCDVNVHIVWMNMGGMTATLTPGYTVDGIPKTFAPVVLEPGQTAALDTVENDLPFKDGMYTICAIPYAVASSV